MYFKNLQVKTCGWPHFNHSSVASSFCLEAWRKQCHCFYSYQQSRYIVMGQHRCDRAMEDNDLARFFWCVLWSMYIHQHLLPVVWRDLQLICDYECCDHWWVTVLLFCGLLSSKTRPFRSSPRIKCTSPPPGVYRSEVGLVQINLHNTGAWRMCVTAGECF